MNQDNLKLVRRNVFPVGQGGDDFITPEETSSVDGKLDMTLTVDVSDVTVEWLTLTRRTYNGGWPSPTLRVRAGDRVNVLLVNPGSEYQYHYELNERQPAGTYWYHAHHHGSTYFQVASGLAGLLIVEDEENSMPDELAAISCPKHCDKEVPMLLGKMLFYGYGRRIDFLRFPAVQKEIGDIFRLDDTLLNWLNESDTTQYLTNGQYVPKVSMQPGEIRRFRLVNVGPTDMLEIYLEGCEMVVLAFDGVYVDEPYETKYVFISDAGRADVAVRCAKAGSYQRPFFNEDLREFPDIQIMGRNVVEFGHTPYINREKMQADNYFRYKFRLGTVQEWYLVNADPLLGHPFHVHVNHFQVVAYNQYNGPVVSYLPNVYPAFYDQQGFLCEQQLVDFPSSALKHLNITVDLRFLGHDTRDRGMAGYVPIGQWRDTILVPPLASITIRFMAHEYNGTCVIHCHFLNHEDKGMMMVTEIVEPDESIGGARVTSGCFYPGTCRSTDEWPDIRNNSP
uniref:ferroxidase n=1 Tax=Branchiostoma floridae TaxID=7739 RepID=C3Y4Q0_BRAFL|eukprot:XP_002608697.1 hypothetical protein BRAFLDRAFT_73918 [Branchiostoma floridae]